MADSVVTFKDASNVTQNHDARTNAAGTELRPTMTIGNDGDYVTGVEPWGALRVSAQWTTLFYDDWGTSPIDTVDKWTTTGTAPSVAAGLMTMPATVSTYNAIRSKDTIRPNLGHTLVRNGITIETTAAVGAGRFWGLGTTATTPAPAVLAQDGVGFEIDQATGGLLAVTYAAGVRTTVATLTAGATPTGTGAVTTSTVPTIRDGINHRYAVYFRVTDAWWFIDSTPVAYVSFPTNQVAALPALIVRQNAASFTGTPTFANIAFLTADSSGQGQSISDPVIGARMARVTPGGALTVSANAAATTGVASGNIFSARAAITTATTSVLQAAPATGLSLYITDVSVSNAGATLCTVSLLPSAGASVLDIVAAATGGGGSMNFGTPIKLAAATGLSVTTSAASTTVFVTVTGYTSP